jgi:hypothetical protein
MDLEAKADEKNGWTRFNPNEISGSEEVAPVNALGVKRKYARKVESLVESAPEGV